MITFQIQDSSQPSGWLDMTQYWAFSSLSEEENDVDGHNAGRTLSALMIRDKVAEKEKFKFESIYLPIETAWHLKQLARREFFQIRTDLKTGTIQSYTVYCGARTMNYALNHADGSQLVKLSFNMIER